MLYSIEIVEQLKCVLSFSNGSDALALSWMEMDDFIAD